MAQTSIAVLGSFVADLAFRTHKAPGWGETIMGSAFKLGPGGKGSNQAVAAARLGARVSFISKLARDPFGELARQTWRQEGIETEFVFDSPDVPTGAAAIIVDQERGENAIVVVPGACFGITPAEVDRARDVIANSSVLLTQLETDLPAVEHALRLAHEAGVVTILNPAPAAPLPDSIFPLCDYLTPNESEAATLTGIAINNAADADRAAAALLQRGARNVVLTLGAQGALVRTATASKLVPAINVGPVVETTGAGDAFNGGFAVALAEGQSTAGAARFACAVAGISVTRPGTAPAMPYRPEVDDLLRRS